MAMVRPRPGDFVLRPGELERMERELDELLTLGADGLVLGCLTGAGAVDVPALARLVAAAGGAPITFHRAFDACPDQGTALEALLDVGVQRVRTSGGAATALEGADALAALIERAAGRIAVMPGGGVRAHNAAELVRRTGAREVHSAVGGLDGPDAARNVADLVAALAR